jgi:3-isopropylmalate/(R)-2-methylmalate dehydratase small subunit
MLPVVLEEEEVAGIVRRARGAQGYRLTVDLERRVVEDGEGFSAPFRIDDFRRYCLLEGLDDIGLTLRRDAEIAAYESRRPAWRAAVTPANGG